MVKPAATAIGEDGLEHFFSAPDWMYSKGGDRQLAERLLFEHGLDPNFRDEIDPEIVEIMAGLGELEDYTADGRCVVRGAGPSDMCDGGLHA